jgi:hypothetical protein
VGAVCQSDATAKQAQPEGDSGNACYELFGEDKEQCLGSDDCTWDEQKVACAARAADARPAEVDAPQEDDWCYLQAGVDKERCDVLSTKCMFVEKVASSVRVPTQMTSESEDTVSSSCAGTLVVMLGFAAFS